MTRIYGPILNQALIYIDDILLFSSDIQAHRHLLKKFASLTEQYGIMLLEKKMQIGLPKIEYLGIKLSQGGYEPYDHIAQ